MLFIGDIHGEFEILHQIFVKNLNNIENEVFIQLGDFGVGFYDISIEKKRLQPIQDWLESKNCIMYVLRGNHDNPHYFRDIDMFGFSNIKLCKDFTILNHDNKNILLVGGALSIDRMHNVLNKTYWVEEEFPKEFPSFSDIDIDIICTHNSPTYVWPFVKSDIVKRYEMLDLELSNDLKVERENISRLYDILSSDEHKRKPVHWYYGHHHQRNISNYNNCKFICCGIFDIYSNYF